MFIKQLSRVTERDIMIVGKKIIILSTIKQENMPPSIIITSLAFMEFVERSGIRDQINTLLSIANSSDESRFEVLERVQSIVMKTDFPSDLKEELEESYHSINITHGKTRAIDLLHSKGDPLVNVRACHISIDGEEGMIKELPFHKNVLGIDELESSIKHCWCVQFTSKAIKEGIGKSAFPSNIAVIVQKTIEPIKSAIAYSASETKKDNSEITILAAFGFPDVFFDGETLCDRYTVGKANLQIEEIKTARQKFALKTDYESRHEVRVEVPADAAEKQKLNDKEIWEIARIVRKASQQNQKEIMAEFLFDGNGFFASNIEILPIIFEKLEERGSEMIYQKEEKVEEKIEEVKEVNKEEPARTESKVPDEPKDIEPDFIEIKDISEIKNPENIIIEDKIADVKATKEDDVKDVFGFELIKDRPKESEIGDLISFMVPKVKSRLGSLPKFEKTAYEEIISKIEGKKRISYEEFRMALDLIKDEIF